jgi:hypothetical protein
MHPLLLPSAYVYGMLTSESRPRRPRMRRRDRTRHGGCRVDARLVVR